jgi:hypothetical protein
MSILDFKRPGLCDEVWDESNELLPEVEKFITNSLSHFFEDQGLSGFVTDIVIGSSLATYYYKEDTDLDIKVIYDPNRLSKDLSDDDLIKLGRENYYTTQFLPGTTHPMDFYFYKDEDFYPINFNKYDSLYSLKKGWLSEPKELSSEPGFILNLAYEKAEPYIIQIMTDIQSVKKNLIDFILFKDYVKSLDDEEIKEVYDSFVSEFDIVNSSIEELVEDKDMFKIMRNRAFEKEDLESELEKVMGSYNYSDENLIFKIMQRYGFMKILVEVKDLYEGRGLSMDNAQEFLEAVG